MNGNGVVVFIWLKQIPFQWANFTSQGNISSFQQISSNDITVRTIHYVPAQHDRSHCATHY